MKNKNVARSKEGSIQKLTWDGVTYELNSPHPISKLVIQDIFIGGERFWVKTSEGTEKL